MTLLRYFFAILIAFLFLSFSPINKRIHYEDAVSLRFKADGAIKGSIKLPKKSLRKVVRKRRSRRYGRNVMRAAKRAKKFNAYQKSMIYLIPLNKKNNRKELKTQTLAQKDVSFQPGHLVVQRGAKVNVLNRDNIFHNVFSTSPIKSFNIGKVRKNVDKVISFESVGHIQVFCDIHAFMSAIISIVDTPYFTKCDKEGNFSIKNVPPGRYKLIGWHSRSEYKASLVDIKAGQFTVVNNMEFK